MWIWGTCTKWLGSQRSSSLKCWPSFIRNNEMQHNLMQYVSVDLMYISMYVCIIAAEKSMTVHFSNLRQLSAQLIFPSFLWWPFWDEDPISLRSQGSNQSQVPDKQHQFKHHRFACNNKFSAIHYSDINNKLCSYNTDSGIMRFRYWCHISKFSFRKWHHN